MTEMEQFIRNYAASIGLNPEVVMQTVLAEGGRSSLEPGGYARQSQLSYKGGQEQSYGPFQMFMGGGLGNRAQQAGIDVTNPADAFRTAQFAMDVMKQEGLGHWHGWKGDKWAARGYQPSGETVAVPNAPVQGPDGPKGQEMYPVAAPPLPAPYDVADKPIFDGRNALAEQVAVAGGPSKKGFFKKLTDNIGKGVTGSSGIGNIAMAPQRGPGPAAARVDAPPTPPINTQIADQQRQMLAQALARLNSGRLA